jgi:glycosyltransferase involved in cell wall biosynthesis
MKLLYFHQHFSTPKGATGTRSYQFAKRCIANGVEVVMVCGSYAGGSTGLTEPFRNGRREGHVDGIQVIEFSLPYSNSTGYVKRTWLFLLYAIRSIRLAMRMDYDLLFATSTPLTAGIPGVFARWFRRKTFVFEVRDLWPELPRAMGVITNPLLLWFMSMLEWVIYHSAHRLVGLSPGICDGIASKGISRDQIHMVSNGCDIEMFQTYVDPWLPAGIRKHDLIFIYSGTFGIANGLNAILDGVVELKSRGVDGFRMIIIGQGSQKAGLLERIHREDLSSHVSILDPVSKEKLVSLFKSCHVGMQILEDVPSFYYGTSPNKFFDYLSAGLPVLCNYPGWVTELVEANACGYSCKPKDAQSFADAVERFLGLGRRISQMGENSLQLASGLFNRNDLSTEWMNWVFFAKKN